MKCFIFGLGVLCFSTFTFGITLPEVVAELEQPTDLVFLPNDPNKLLIAEKTGRLVLSNLPDNTQNAVHTFDVRTASELGLLGIALHPKFDKNSYLFVNYNPEDGERRTRVSRFTMSLSPNKLALSNEKIILEVEQPYKNHNAGQIAFGPDGYLYIGMGDGGSGGDPKGHGQNLSTLLGNMLRIDVDTNSEQAYQVPSDNPFVGNSQALDEIWAYGLRNPWRFTFHQDALILADVGQSKLEEVNLIHKAKNYGWKVMEGNQCFKDKKQTCDKSAYEQPVLTYPREDGLSITGGKVYVKGSVKKLLNRYVYADFILGNIWSVNYPDFTDNRLEADTDINISAFTLDTNGELYLADYANGKILRVAD